MEVPLSTEICRCCLAPGNYKSLKDTFQWMGQNENYGDMLKECFNVTLCDANDSCHGGICELCITQLRNARNFKKQVLKSDEVFKQGLDNNFKGEEVKIEFLNENDLDSDTGNQDDYFAGLETEEETEVPVKEEITVATKSRKRTVERKVPVKNDAPAKKKKPEGETSGKGGNVGRRKIYSTTVRRRSVEDLPEPTKQRHNLNILLKHSNVTPFKDRTVLGYHCAYCSEVFIKPDDLRSHTCGEHEDIKFSYKSDSSVNNFIAFLDITNLKCAICEMQIEYLKMLIDHLTEVHGKKYYKNIPDYIQPFKLTSDRTMNCCLCEEVFENFKSLASHMNAHYKNFVCQICGISFANKYRLSRHEKIHENGKYPCGHCNKVYLNDTKRRSHERSVHLRHADSKCQICGRKFSNFYQKAKHMAEEHNAEPLKCDFCEKTFVAKSLLGIHTRKHHLMERAHECDVCKQRFFLKIRLREHYVTHTGEKLFGCELCGNRYAYKKSLIYHKNKTHKA